MVLNKITKIKKRDGTIIDFDQSRITNVIFKAITAAGQGDGNRSKKLSDKVIQILNRRFKKDEIADVEQIQDIVEEVLILEGLVETAKAYILYREQRRRVREAVTISEETVERMDQYLGRLDWEVQENANMAFSLQGLNHYAVSQIVKKYWLNKIYPKEIREANEAGDFHIHNLDTLGTYCAGWDLYDLLLKGFGGIPGKVETKPAKHFRAILGQAVNFLYTLQGEVAGAVAFSNFDTLLAPFIRYDNLNYRQTKQALQEFMFNMSVPTRVGFQNPFSNITLDLKPSPVFAKQPVIIGGKPQNEVYGEFGEEMKIFNKALYEVMVEGDAKQRVFTFPIPTINITKDFPWDDPNFNPIFDASAKYGINYFANYINSDMNPEDVKSMCFTADTKLIYKEGKHSRYQRTTIRNLVNNWGPQKEFYLLMNGEWVKIKDSFKLKNNTGKIIKVTLKNGEVVKMTPDHPAIIVENGKFKQVPAKNLKEGDIVPIAKKSYEGGLGDFELGRWLGLYVSEGGIAKENTVYFSFNEEEKEFQKFIKDIAEKRFAFPVHVTKDSRWKTVQVWVKSKAAVEWVRKFCSGNCATEKRLLSSLYGMSKDFRLGALIGIYQGDGYERDVEFHTTNKKLRNDVADLARSVEINYTKRVNQNNTKGEKPFTSYTLRLCRDNLKNLEPHFKNIETSTSSIYQDFGNFYGIKIRSIKIQNYHALVYDFEVDSKEHLFQLSNGVITHNCCRLRLDLKELHNRGGGGLFGSGSKTGCYDEKTEILTENGWELFKDLTKESRVFTLAQDNKIELHKPIKLFEYDYKGKMINFKGRSFDLLVTPNHRMVVDHKYKNKRMFVEAKDFKLYQHFIPKGGFWKGEEKEYFILPSVEIFKGVGPISRFSEKELENIRQMRKEGMAYYKIAGDFNCNTVTILNICNNPKYGQHKLWSYQAEPLKIKMNDWLKFFGFWLAEGCTDNENIAPGHGYRSVITQVNNEKREEIKKVLDVLPFNYYEDKNNIVICNKQLWTYLRQFGNKYQKFIPKEIKALSKRQLEILFEWLIKGDGHRRKTTGQINYWTASKKLAGDLQEIILKLGWLGVLTFQKKKISQIKGRDITAGIIYTIGVHRKTKHFAFNKKRVIKRINYEGKVYCCEVPNHTVFVRRNGKVTWCGNSIGVVTINLPRIGYLSKTKKDFLGKLGKMMDLAKESLEIKRKTIENFISKGLYPYSRFYLTDIKKARGEYYANHFATIGLVGMNEALLNFLGETIASKRGRVFALEVLDFMRKKLIKYQEETGNIYNLEATPAESTAYRLALKDKELYPEIITAGTKKVPYYTNSTQLPVNYTNDIFEALKLQDEIQCKYNGGTVLHLFAGERVSDAETIKGLIKKIFENFHLPYVTFTPTFSICPVHGYIVGEHFYCPQCTIKQPCEVYSRIVGYLRPVQQWNEGKQGEFQQRKEFKIPKMTTLSK